MPVTVFHTRDGRLDQDDLLKLDDLASRIAGKPANVLLHLHGGLVPQATGEEIAARLSGQTENSFKAPDDWEQIYVVWRTGAFETIRTNWSDLATNDRLYRALLKRLIGYVGSKLRLPTDSGRSVASSLGLSPAEISARLDGGLDAPFADVDAAIAGIDGPIVEQTADQVLEAEFRTALQLDPEFTAAVEDLDAALNPVRAGRGGTSGKGDEAAGRRMLARLDGTVRGELTAEADDALGRGVFSSAALLKSLVQHAAKIALRVLKRFKNRRDHGLHATIVEEVLRELYGDIAGSAIWGMMKKDAFDHFEAVGLGPALVTALQGTTGARLRVTGHSAGSIWATALLEYLAAKAPSLKFDVVFLAPAVRVKDFARMIKSAGNNIKSFRLFAMSDLWEARDAVLGKGKAAIYPSSLLYLVSGLFEESGSDGVVDAPILGMQRFFPGGAPASFVTESQEKTALEAAAAFLSSIPNAACYSPSNAGDGLRCQAAAHGDFDIDAPTLASVRHFLA